MLNNPVSSSADMARRLQTGSAANHFDVESQVYLNTEGESVAAWDLDLKTNNFSDPPFPARIFGRENPEIFNYQQLLNQVHPDDLPHVEQAFDRAMRTGVYYHEARIVWPDHSFHWIRTSGRVVFDKAHKPKRILGITQDITSEKQIIVNDQQSEIRYRQIIYSLPFAFYTCDADGNIGIYNEAAVQLWGRSPGKDDQWCGSFKIFRPDGTTLPADECPMAVTLKTGRIVKDAEILIERPDGTRINVLPYPRPVYDGKGNITGGVNMLVDVSDRKKIEKDTAWLAAIVESSEDAVVSKTLEGVVTSWNAGAEKLFGYTSDEMIGQPISKLFPEDRMDEEPKILDQIKRGEVINHFDTIRLNKSGHPIDISLTISPIKDKNGNLIGASKIARNITIQKNLLKALQENEQRLQIAIKAAELGTWEFNPVTEETQYSRRYLEIMGFDENENPTHAELISRVHPEDNLRRKEGFQRALNTGVLDMELRVVHRDHSIHWIKARGKTFYDAYGQPERLLGTILDITPQKKAFEALQESELLFKTIANVAPVGLWMTDKQARNNFANDTWIEWTGLPLEEQYDSGWMSCVLPEDATRVKNRFEQALASLESFNDEFRLVRQDGETRWCLTEGFPFFNDKGQFEGYAGSVTDITERKMIEKELEIKVKERTQALNIANSALEKSNDELEQFAYVASHDLQEPLRKIKTFVGRLHESMETKVDGHSKVYMDKIIASTNRMSDLIHDLLEYSRTAKISEKHSLTDLNEVFENVIGDLEILINQKKAVIHSEKLPVLYAVPHQMNQLFTNLISNSLKFLDESKAPEITISAADVTSEKAKIFGLEPDKKYTEIIFTDNGIGFSNEYAEKIFEIFQRLNPRSAYSGSGIGLSICRKIVSNHHGIIFANSIEGKGASFHIVLPVENI